MQARFRLLVLVFVGLLFPAAARAQQSNNTATAAGPRVEVLSTGISTPDGRVESALVLQQRRQSVGKPVALMIVGGAAIVLGAVIGDDVGTLFMIGGAVALLIGLYQYLK
jgi:hypothetical protein